MGQVKINKLLEEQLYRSKTSMFTAQIRYSKRENSLGKGEKHKFTYHSLSSLIILPKTNMLQYGNNIYTPYTESTESGLCPPL